MNEPIKHKFLRPNYYFGLMFNEGWVFGRVINRRFCRYKPYKLINEAGTAQSIATGTAQSELLLKDPRNTDNDLLYLGDYKSDDGFPWFYHVGIGIKPSGVRCWMRYPETTEVPGKFPQLDPIKPDSNENLGYFTMDDSPFEEPTEFTEFVLMPKTRVGFQYYNNESYTVRPVLNIEVMLYKVEILNRTTHANIISQIASGTRPAALFRIGYGNKPIGMEQAFKNDWKAELLTLSEAQQLGRKF